MKKLTLPSTDLSVAPLCFGAGGFGTETKGDAALTLVREYVAVGGNFFDTAHVYGGWAPEGAGASEVELGRCLRELGIAGDSVIATKGASPAIEGYPRPDDFLSEAVIASDIEDSLNRLQVDTIDLYYLHRDDGKRPVSEVIDQLNGEIRRGRLRALGASNWSVERIDAANEYARSHGLQGFCISQVQWSLAASKSDGYTGEPGPDPVNRAVGTEEFAYHQRMGLPVAAYTATAGGYFADSASGNRSFDNPVNQERRARARALATVLNATPTQVALAWLMAQPFPTLPIFSTTSPDHLREIMGAANIELTPEQAASLIA